MPVPLHDSISAVLRSDAVAALAALFVIAGSHRELYIWASRAICGSVEPLSPRLNGHGGNGDGVKRRGVTSYSDNQFDAVDQALLEAMRASTGGAIADWAKATGRSKSSTVNDLHRLRDAGLVESIDRKWRLVEEPGPKEPPARWTKPLSGADRAAQHHLT